MDYMSTDFGADSQSRFRFRARTNKQTRLNALPHAGGYAAGVGNKKRLSQKVHCPVQVLQSGKAVLREKEFVKGVGFKTVMEVREISILRVVNRQKKKM